MSIRPATINDLDRILDLGELMHKESPSWSRIRFSRDRASETIQHLLTSANGVVFVAEKKGVIVGGIMAYAEKHWSSDDVIATEMSFFLLPEARGSIDAARLVCALRSWAEIKNAVWLDAGTSTGLDQERTATFYEALGFSRKSIGLEVFYGS